MEDIIEKVILLGGNELEFGLIYHRAKSRKNVQNYMQTAGTEVADSVSFHSYTQPRIIALNSHTLLNNLDFRKEM